MNKLFFMQPRQSGKTDKAIYEYLKDPDNTIFVTHNSHSAQLIRDKVSGDMKNFILSEVFVNKLIDIRAKTIILDEYMSFKNKDILYQKIKVIKPENLFIFSTPNKSYDRVLFYLVKENKNMVSYHGILKKYSKDFELTKEIEKDIYDLYYNFLTDSDTKIINQSTSKLPNNTIEQLKLQLTSEQYLIEVKGEYLKNN